MTTPKINTEFDTRNDEALQIAIDYAIKTGRLLNGQRVPKSQRISIDDQSKMTTLAKNAYHRPKTSVTSNELSKCSYDMQCNKDPYIQYIAGIAHTYLVDHYDLQEKINRYTSKDIPERYNFVKMHQDLMADYTRNRDSVAQIAKRALQHLKNENIKNKINKLFTEIQRLDAQYPNNNWKVRIPHGKI